MTLGSMTRIHDTRNRDSEPDSDVCPSPSPAGPQADLDPERKVILRLFQSEHRFNALIEMVRKINTRGDFMEILKISHQKIKVGHSYIRKPHFKFS